MKTLSLCLLACLLPLVCFAQWTAHDVTTTGDGAVDAFAADFDNDGDLDVVGACVIEWTASWWENTNGLGTEWTEHVLPGTVYGILSVHADDVNGDGEMDILAAFSVDENVRWWENNGGGASWSIRTVGALSDAQCVISADVTNDGDVDVIASGGDQIVFWENVGGSGTTWNQHNITVGVNWVHHVDVGYVNDDDYIDVVAATSQGDEVLWCENPGLGLPSWERRNVDADFNGACCVRVADMDDDGSNDVIACGAGNSLVSWWRNVDGAGTSWTENAVGSILFPEFVVPVDLDADGDLDVGCASYSDTDINWYENTDGVGTTWMAHAVESDFESASSVEAFDFSGDGVPDLLGTSYATDRITWWEFDGGTPDPVVLTLTPTSPTTIPAAGGTLVYDVHLISNLAYPVSGLRYWTDAILPNGSTYGPIMVQPFTMTAFMDVTVPDMTQTIPAMAPAGVYQFRGHVGYMAGPQVGDSFPFTKQETAVDNGGVSAAPDAESWRAGGVWTVTGDPAEGEKLDSSLENARIPVEYALTEVHPNPFNASATVTVELPEVSELTIAVYNVTGQGVAELVRGRVAAGTHSCVFDGSSLASGIYFVRAAVPGRLNAMQKVVLVK